MVPEGWGSYILGDLFDFKNGLNTDAENYGSGTKFVNVMDIFAGPSITQESIRGSVNVSDTQFETYSLKRGDVLFNRTSETPDEIAFASVYLDDLPAIFGGFVIRARPKTSHIVPEFSKYCFRTSAIRRELIRRCQGAIRGNIGQTEMRGVRMFLPSVSEQLRISEILVTWDQAIESLEKLIENSDLQKSALVQRMLWGEERLISFNDVTELQSTKYGSIPKSWDFLPIRSIASEVSERNGDGQDLPVLSCSKHYGFVNSLEYFRKKVYSDDTSNYKIIPRGVFGFPANHIEEGSIGYQDICDAGLVSPIYVLFKSNDSVCDGYLYRILKTDHYRQIFAAATNSSVDRRGSLRWKDFSTIYVPLPSVVEQQAISRVLDVAEQETNSLRCQLKKLTNEKTGLLQQLLTGKRRVKIDSDVDRIVEEAAAHG